MTNGLLDDARKMIEGEIRRLIAKTYPKAGKSPEEEKYNEYMRRASNLMIGLISSERARTCKVQVHKAIELFNFAHKQFEDRWAPLNAMAKCYYLLGNLREAEIHNKHALINCSEDKDRICSHHLLKSQIHLDRRELEHAEHSILDAISVVPKNIHARKAYLRILSASEASSIFHQIEIVQDFPEFARWANDFITVIDGEQEFEFLRQSSQWKTIRSNWLNKVEAELSKATINENTDSTSDEGGTYRRLAKIAAVVGVGLALNIVFHGVAELVDLTEIFGSDGSDVGQVEAIEVGIGDVEPFAQIEVAGDVEPFLTLAMEAGAVSSLSPLAEANIWAHDLLIS